MTELTAREGEVLRLASDGLSNDEIADRLDISRRTVEAHLRTLFRKTGVSRRGQLAAVATDRPPPVVDDRRRIERYELALRRLAERHLSLFQERAEITFTVGGPDGQDAVLERRWTTPRPYVVYRTLRPVVPDTAADRIDPDRLGLSCDVHGRDVRAEALTVIEPGGRPLALVLFQPGLDQPTEWSLRYRTDGLWDPLRAGGVDELAWGTTGEAGPNPTVTGLTVRLVFPPGWTGVGLTERDGAGVVSEVVRQPSGQQVLSWQDDEPRELAYHWRITGTPDA